MEPTERELYCRETAKLLCFVMTQVDKYPVDLSDAKLVAKDMYPSRDLTKYLCALLKNLDETQKSEILYNGRQAISRRLADWWENHQEVDRKHAESDKKKLYKLKKSLADLNKQISEITKEIQYLESE